MLLVDWMIRDLCIVGEGQGGYYTCPDEDLGCDLVINGYNNKPMLEPFSEGVSGDGIVSYGVTSGGYDLRLGNEFWISKPSYGEIVRPRRMKDPGYADKLFDKITLEIDQEFILPAHSYVLARTLEYIRIPRLIRGTCTGKSTLARCGILINTTPLEPEWHGYLTVEIGNVSPSPVALVVGEGIAQLEFHVLAGNPEKSYSDKGGIYQAQMGVVPARVK